MQCPNCHTEIASQSAFCTNCGANLSAAAPPTTYAEAPSATVPPPVASSGLSPTAASAIAYLTFIPAVIFLLIEPYNRIPLVRFHSFQSIGLAIFAFIVDLAVKMLLLPISFTMYSMIQGLVTVGLFIIWLVVVLKALKGEWFKLPIIGDFAMKQAQG